MVHPDPNATADANKATADPNLATTQGGHPPGRDTPGKPSPTTRYQKLVPLGEGPDSRVWRAYDNELRRIVVIKTLREERISESAGFVAGARNIASIRHPGIVRIHDIVEDTDGISIISDHVEGGSLAVRLTKAPCTVGEVLEWGAQLAETMAFIHAKGIIHADITPANILLSEDGQALLSNFCSARTVSSTPSPTTMAEKAPYLPPELAQRDALEPRSDVFSLGTLLLEALTGCRPQPASGPGKAIQGSPAEARALPAPLHALLTRCVSPQPFERPSAQELATALRKLQSPRQRRSLWFAAATATGIIAVAIAYWFFLGPGRHNADHESRARGQVEQLSRELKERNPGFDGKLTPGIEGGLITRIELSTKNISDLSPLRSMRDLTFLQATDPRGEGRIRDISPIQGLNIKRLELHGNPILDDLGPLAGMPLEHLNIKGTAVADLAALAGAPLKTVICENTKVKTLAPLADAPLATLWINNCGISTLDGLRNIRLLNLRANGTALRDIHALRGMPLQVVECMDTAVDSIEPLRGAESLVVLTIAKTKINSLEPLLSLPRLKILYCDINWKRDQHVVRQLSRLEMINDSNPANLIRWYVGGQEGTRPGRNFP